MLCQTCVKIPLDLFLPKTAWGSYRNGRAWWESTAVRKGANAIQELHESVKEDCRLCTIIEGVLENSEPFWATGEFSGSDHDKLLHAPRSGSLGELAEEKLPTGLYLGVQKEGEILVTDGRRTAGLYWVVESMGYGTPRLSVQDRADCEDNFTLTKKWLKTCVSEHDACRTSKSNQEQFLPTRLIDVGEPAQGIPPRLILTSNLSISSGSQHSYLALSHCWGTDRGKTVPKTITDNILAHLEAIPLGILPKTFLDAMEIVRKLSHRYLWIDSLCIIQDLPADFQTECSRMHLVYSQSLCTIVAADSPDGDVGCFVSRDLARVKPCKLTLTNHHIPYHPTSIMDVIRERFPDVPETAEVIIYPNFGPWIKAVRSGAVFGRGWCLQEREMSPRVLHYTRDRIMWECRACTASEDAPAMEAKLAKNEKLAPHLSSFRVLDDESLHVMSRLANKVALKSNKWDKVVETYSRRKLSVGSDKLPAISGIARFVADRLQGGGGGGQDGEEKYVAGLWKRELLKGLSWFPDRDGEGEGRLVKSDEWPPVGVDEGRIPSWSWASYDGPIKFVGDSWFGGAWGKVVGSDGKEEWVKIGPEMVVKSVSVTHDSIDPFGRISGGELVLEAWTAWFMVGESHLVVESVDDPVRRKAANFRGKCYKGMVEYDLPKVRIFFDHDVDELPQNTKILCVQLDTGSSVRGGDPKAHTGLALVSVGKGDAWRRVGMFDLTGERAWWDAIREKKEVIVV